MSATEQHTPAWGEPGSWITLPDGRAAQVWSTAPLDSLLRISVPVVSWPDRTGLLHAASLRWAIDTDQGVHLVDLDELDTQPVAQDDLFGGAG